MLKRMTSDVQRDPNSHVAYTLENDRLHYKGRMMLSASSACIPKLLAEFHVTKTRRSLGCMGFQSRL